ncbi:MAG: aspartate aminotransferase, partial [Candidatus Omnitrophota bacterium]
VLSLAAGEPDFPTPTNVRDAIQKSLENGFTKYTPTSGVPELKEAVVNKIKRDQKIYIELGNVAISCGAKHSLYNIIQVLVNPGDEVIVPAPYWVSYPEMVKLASATPVFIDTSKTKFILTADVLRSALTEKSRVVILNSPSNPTGAVIPVPELKKIAELAREKNLIIISDEIYENFVYDQLKHVSIAEVMADWQDYVIIVNGVSKSHSMTGLRIGYTVANAALIKKIGIVQDHSTSNPTSISQKGAIEALTMDVSFSEEMRSKFEIKRDLIVDLVNQIDQLSIVVPQGAFYAFVSVAKTGLKPNDFCDRLLEEHYVATIPGEGFGSEDCIRLSFAASIEDIKEAFKRLKTFIDSI